MKLFYLLTVSNLVECRPSSQAIGNLLPGKAPDLNEKLANFFKNASKSSSKETFDAVMATEAGVVVGLGSAYTIFKDAGVDNDDIRELLDETLDRTDEYFLTMFGETGEGQWVSNNMSLLDGRKTDLDEIMSKYKKESFDPEFLVDGREEDAKNVARGHYTVGKELIDLILDRLRKLAAGETEIDGIFDSFTLKKLRVDIKNAFGLGRNLRKLPTKPLHAKLYSRLTNAPIFPVSKANQ